MYVTAAFAGAWSKTPSAEYDCGYPDTNESRSTVHITGHQWVWLWVDQNTNESDSMVGHCGVPMLYFTVGWRDFPLLFRFSKMAILLPIRYNFYEFNSKKSANFAARAAKFFFYKKSQGPYKLIFVLNLQIPSFYFKELSPKRKTK